MIKKYLFNKTLKNNKNKEKFMKIKFKLLKNIKKKSTISCPHYLIFIILIDALSKNLSSFSV